MLIVSCVNFSTHLTRAASLKAAVFSQGSTCHSAGSRFYHHKFNLTAFPFHSVNHRCWGRTPCVARPSRGRAAAPSTLINGWRSRLKGTTWKRTSRRTGVEHRVEPGAAKWEQANSWSPGVVVCWVRSSSVLNLIPGGLAFKQDRIGPGLQGKDSVLQQKLTQQICETYLRCQGDQSKCMRQ